MELKDDTKLIITLGFSAMLALMSLLIYIALGQLHNLNQSMSNVVEETNAKMEAANSMRDSILLRANSLKTMALTDDPFERDTEYMRFIDHARIYRVAREKLLAKRMDSREEEIHALLSSAAHIAQPFNEAAAERLLGNTSITEISAAVSEAVKYQEPLLNLLDELVALERESAVASLQSANDHYDKSRRIMFILAAIALVIGLSIAILVIRRSTEKNRHIYYQANHDALTGLLNRRAFEKELDLLVTAPESDGVENALLYLDLDQFKIVNDTCGHLAGDTLLCQLTNVFLNQLRKTDLIARLGGDEFGVLLKNCNVAGASRVAEVLRESAEKFQFSWKGKIFSIGASIGVVPIRHDSGDMATVLSTADMACLEAKNAGRNQVRIANFDDQYIAARRSEMDCVGRIKTALLEDRLCLYYQPVVAVGNAANKSDHVEILVRMINVDGELIQPACFIPAAERYGLMRAIDQWVIKHAILWLQEWSSVNAAPKLMINLSGQSICDESFLPFIQETLDSGDIQPGRVCFEITETAAIANLDKAVSFINALKAKGCEFALDDFGSGLSSFAYLKSLPVDYLKIDGAFVKEIVNQPIDHAMVKSINEIGHVMGKQTIAEFVEDDAILKKLETIGVDYAQGYGIARPQPLDTFGRRVAHSEKPMMRSCTASKCEPREQNLQLTQSKIKLKA